MHLVESDLPHITTFAVAKIEVADFYSPAVYRTTVAGRVEQDIFVRQIDRLYIGKSQAGSDLFQFPGGHFHFVQVEVVFFL